MAGVKVPADTKMLADWPEKQIADAAEVQAAGGRVLRIPLSPGRSTTAIIRRIAKHVAG